MIGTRLPARDLLLRVCADDISSTHPVAHAASQLARLHRDRLRDGGLGSCDIDCERARLTRLIDRWVAGEMPRPHGGAAMHTETVGMVVDRLARYCATAHSALTAPTTNWALHCAWRSLAEISLAYDDLAADLAGGHRRLPEFTYPVIPAVGGAR
ncbi:DUF4254 domain-containing protein [Nocardia veterana]|uniref:DUF4254 domain-containing protein n=1 Tax=Nocardia veterana TaxID=132249 RepID=A0A7X6RKL2_9NOCA|nr:DUF4254 domain-containing protein [Nocardia veterana]NKY88838.1 DUF4254 domain-containing protein [Nocardia veterana]